MEAVTGSLLLKVSEAQTEPVLVGLTVQSEGWAARRASAAGTPNLLH